MAAVVSDEPAGMVAVASGCDTPGRVSEHFAEGLCWRLRRRAIELSLVKIVSTKFKGWLPFLLSPWARSVSSLHFSFSNSDVGRNRASAD